MHCQVININETTEVEVFDQPRPIDVRCAWLDVTVDNFETKYCFASLDAIEAFALRILARVESARAMASAQVPQVCKIVADPPYTVAEAIA